MIAEHPMSLWYQVTTVMVMESAVNLIDLKEHENVFVFCYHFSTPMRPMQLKFSYMYIMGIFPCLLRRYLHRDRAQKFINGWTQRQGKE